MPFPKGHKVIRQPAKGPLPCVKSTKGKSRTEDCWEGTGIRPRLPRLRPDRAGSLGIEQGREQG